MQNRVADLSVPQISDTQAAVEALAILPKLFAQQGLSSFRTQQESDGRYTLLMGIAKAENLANPSAFSLTLNPHQSHLERFRAEVALEEKASITLTEVVESITNAGPLPAFAFQIPRRAKKVKELAPLLDSL